MRSEELGVVSWELGVRSEELGVFMSKFDEDVLTTKDTKDTKKELFLIITLTGLELIMRNQELLSS